MKDRENLPFRKNCEGYFLCDDGKIIALDTGKGYLELPGGGVDEGENPETALIREAYEEAGVILDGNLKEIEKLSFIWDNNWAKTEKQKKRYAKFKGEEMHFFLGKVKKLVSPPGDPITGESGWNGERKMSIDNAIEIISNEKPFSKDMAPYREIQLKILNSLKENSI
mgnify:CR=1 FL=1